MVRVRGSDGKRWRVGRRWLAWRPRPSRALRGSWRLLRETWDDATLILLAVAVVALLPLGLLHALHWVAALIATPFAIVTRPALGRRLTVVATSRGTEFRARTADRQEADVLINQVRHELAETGEPVSLAAVTPIHPNPTPLARPPSNEPPRGWPPLLHPIVKWIRLQTPPQPPSGRDT